MAARALPVTTIDSQAAGGTCALERMISTSSPFFSSVISGMMRPLTLAPTQCVADIGVHGIGEIDRGGAARQRDQPALRREAEDLVLEQLELGVFQEVLGVVALGQLLDGAAQPAIGVGLLGDLVAGAVRLAGMSL